MAILKIVPEEVYQVLMEYLSDSDVVLLPEAVLMEFSPNVQRKFRQMEQEGQVDYDFRSDWGYAYKTLATAEDGGSENLT